MKKVISIVTLALLVTFSSFPAFAAERLTKEYDSSRISTNFINIRILQAGLTISSSGRANCTGEVMIYNSSDTVKLSTQIQKYSNGSWSAVKTWSISAKGNTPARIVKSYYITSGKYRVMSTARVYSTSGYLLETQTAYSSAKSY